MLVSAERGKFQDENALVEKNKEAEAGFQNVQAPNFNGNWFPGVKETLEAAEKQLTEGDKIKKPLVDKEGAALGRQVEVSFGIFIEF